MYAIFIKELNSFFSSLTGIIAAIVFLVISGLFIWVFPGELNVLDGGYATLDSLFIIAPWVFMFLIPALTMRSFAEEKRTGTIELLLTRPISEMQLVLGKFLATVVLVLIILIPAAIFFLSVYLLGNPRGNIDVGGTWGSFIGLFFLASAYASMGIFASSLTRNHIVAFMIAALLCFFMFVGIGTMSSLYIFKKIEYGLLWLSIHEHYRSISRGVIDTRDLYYFAGLAAFFIMLTRLVLQSRKW